MSLLDYLIDKHGYNELIFASELRTADRQALSQDLQQLIDSNEIYKYANGIYFIPNPNSTFKKEDLDELIKKKLRSKINCSN